jgi:hypothetical protein
MKIKKVVIIIKFYSKFAFFIETIIITEFKKDFQIFFNFLFKVFFIKIMTIVLIETYKKGY